MDEGETEDGIPTWLSRTPKGESTTDSVHMLLIRSMGRKLISQAHENAVQNIGELRQLVEQWETEEQAYYEASASGVAPSEPTDVDLRFESHVQRFFAQRHQPACSVTESFEEERGNGPWTAELVQNIYKNVKSTWQYPISPTDENGLSDELEQSERDLAFPSLISRCVSSEYVEEKRWKDVLYADRRPYMSVPPSYNSRRLSENREEAFANLKREYFFELLRKEQFAEAVRCSSSDSQGETDSSYALKQDLASSTPGSLAPPRKPLYRATHDDDVTMSDTLRLLSTDEGFSFPLIADSEGRGLNMDIPSSVPYMDVIPENVFEELAEDDPDMYRTRPFLVLMDSPDGDDGQDSTNGSLTPKDLLEFGVSSTESSQPMEQIETPSGVSEYDVLSPFSFPLAPPACFRPPETSPQSERTVEESGVSSQDTSSFSIEERSPTSSLGTAEDKFLSVEPDDGRLSQDSPFLMPDLCETSIVAYTFIQEDLISAVYATEPSPTSSQTSLSNIERIQPAESPVNTFDNSEDDSLCLNLPEEAFINEGSITTEHTSLLTKQITDEIDCLVRIGGDELVPNMYAAGGPHVLMKEEIVSETNTSMAFDDTTSTTQTFEPTEQYIMRDVFCQVDEGAFSNDSKTSMQTKHEVKGGESFSRDLSFSGGGSDQQRGGIESMTPLSMGFSDEIIEQNANVRAQQVPTVVENSVTTTKTTFYVEGMSPDLSVSDLNVPISTSPIDVTKENFAPKESATGIDTSTLSMVPSPNSNSSRSVDSLSIAPFLSGSDLSLPTEKSDWSVLSAAEESSSELDLFAKASNVTGMYQSDSFPVDYNICCQESCAPLLKSKVKCERASPSSNSCTVPIPLGKEMLPVLGNVIQVMESIFSASGAAGQLISRLGQ